MTTNDTHTPRQRAANEAWLRDLDKDDPVHGGCFDGYDSQQEAFEAGWLARDAEPTAVTAEQITSEIYKVTSNWDEPLDEVHDIPQITNALLARFRIEGDPA